MTATWLEIGWLEIGLSNALLATGLALVAWLVTRVCRHPKVVFAVWLLVLAKLLVPPVWGIPWPNWPLAALTETAPDETLHQEPRATTLLAKSSVTDSAPQASGARHDSADVAAASSGDRAAPAETAGPMPPGRQLPSLRTMVCSLWLTGSAAWLLMAVVRIVRFERTLTRAPLAPAELAAEAAAVARQLGLRRVPTVRLVRAAVPPLVWALLRRPSIVLPARLVSRLSTDQRATLLAHELAHLKRRDHLVRLVEMAALALYWWHPVAWWARRHLERAGEACCDATVVALFPGRTRAYAETLMATVDFFADARPALPVGSSRMSQLPLLRRRLEMILAPNTLRRVSWPLRLALVSLAMVVLPPCMQSVSAEPKTVKPFVPKNGTIEQRLDRLERALQTLTVELRAMHNTQLENAEPVVVKTIPEDGDNAVDPNLKEIRVTFSKEMNDGSWSWTQSGRAAFPEVTGKIHYLPDGRTCVLPVKLEPGTTYWIGLNSQKFKNFKDKNLRPAIPYPLNFKTKD